MNENEKKIIENRMKIFISFPQKRWKVKCYMWRKEKRERIIDFKTKEDFFLVFVVLLNIF